MGRGDAAMARGWKPAHQPLDAEVLQTGADPDDVHQRIKGTNLMEVHLLRCVAMDRRLCLRQQPEHRQHPLLKRGVQGSRLQALAQLAPAPVVRLGLQRLHAQLPAAQASAAALLLHQPVASGQPEGCQRFLHHRGWQAEIEQGRQEHVPRQAGGAIEHRQAHAASRGSGAASGRGRSSRGAIASRASARDCSRS